MKTTCTDFQSIFAEGIKQFLVHKHNLGRCYAVEEKTLRLFDRYLIAQKVAHPNQVTPAFIDGFLASRPRYRPRSYNHLLSTVRRLFDWLVNQSVLDRSPVEARPRRQTSQRIPFIFDQSSARRLLELAKDLPDNSRAPMRGNTYHAIFAILYGLGLRVGEVCRLRLSDVDLDRQLLVIRKTKFYKSRLVPFGPRMSVLLREYHQARVLRRGPLSPDMPFFSFTKRGEIHPGTISQLFHALVPRLRLEIPAGCSPPRLHDLRHSFAVGTLVRWYRSGVDPGAGLLKLATFLGHVDVNSTAVYLNVTTTLLQEANRRFEAFAENIFTEGLYS
jgi:site-specific recombinase XerD